MEKISASAIKNSAAKIFKKGSLLVGMYDTAAMKISILREDSSCNQACANVECNELASVEWLYSYIDCAKDSYLSLRRGVRQKNLNLGMIRDFQLPLPPRELQDEFVTFVSAVLGMKMRQEECKDFPVFESLSQKPSEANCEKPKAFTRTSLCSGLRPSLRLCKCDPVTFVSSQL